MERRKFVDSLPSRKAKAEKKSSSNAYKSGSKQGLGERGNQGNFFRVFFLFPSDVCVGRKLTECLSLYFVRMWEENIFDGEGKTFSLLS